MASHKFSFLVTLALRSGEDWRLEVLGMETCLSPAAEDVNEFPSLLSSKDYLSSMPRVSQAADIPSNFVPDKLTCEENVHSLNGLAPYAGVLQNSLSS